MVDAWTEAAIIQEGRLFRAINKGGEVWGDSFSEKVIWSVVQEYAAGIGVARVAPLL